MKKFSVFPSEQQEGCTLTYLLKYRVKYLRVRLISYDRRENLIGTKYNSIVGEFQTIHVIHITQWQASILSRNVSTCCYRETKIEDTLPSRSTTCLWFPSTRERFYERIRAKDYGNQPSEKNLGKNGSLHAEKLSQSDKDSLRLSKIGNGKKVDDPRLVLHCSIYDVYTIYQSIHARRNQYADWEAVAESGYRLASV